MKRRSLGSVLLGVLQHQLNYTLPIISRKPVPMFHAPILSHKTVSGNPGAVHSRDVYAFRDTLDAGEARLIQVFDDSLGLDADVRITDPDVNAILPVRNDTLLDSRSVPGETVDILARFYNMGTEPKNT